MTIKYTYWNNNGLYQKLLNEMEAAGWWEPGFQAWAQSTCPELSAQGLVPLRWGCALPSPNAPGKAPNHPLERDQGVGELLESHQGCQVFTLEV